jgi:hypothetical protein
MKGWKPWFVENSRIPIWLSYISPITIGAITLGFVVCARGEMDERTRRHETIHFQQFVETLFFGFLILYLWDFLWGYVRYGNGGIAYQNIRAEREAYLFDMEEGYLDVRKRWKWIWSDSGRSSPIV